MTRRRRDRATAAGDDGGSVLLLTIGYAILAIAAVLVCVDATSLYLARQRLDAVADAAALAGADAFRLVVDDGEPRAVLESDAVRGSAQAFVTDAGDGARLIEATSPDGRSARITVASRWSPPVFAPFIPGAVDLRSTSTSRAAVG